MFEKTTLYDQCDYTDSVRQVMIHLIVINTWGLIQALNGGLIPKINGNIKREKLHR
jgi:hypothetical protein